ncbi:MAG: hypothetical protein ACREC6_00110 [Hyphomicrobiaceae bacterium]
MISTVLTEIMTASPSGTFLAGVGVLAAAALIGGLVHWSLGQVRDRWGIGRAILQGLRAADAILVTYGSYAAGTRWDSPLVRWAAMLSVLGAIAIGGVFLPWPWALWLLIIGLAVVFVVFRHWVHDWKEARRGIEPEDKTIRISGDLTAQMLVACGFVAIYASMAFARLHAAGHSFEMRPDAGPFAFVLFTLLEILKVLPIVDYYDIFADELRFDRIGAAGAPSPAAKWGVFVFRAVFEVIVLTGLIGLVGALRRATQDADLHAFDAVLVRNDREAQKKAIVRLKKLALRGRRGAAERLERIVTETLGHNGLRFAVDVRFAAAGALVEYGERHDGAAPLLLAIEAYRHIARADWTRERVPLDWAMAQDKLGAALTALGQRESGTARLEDAVAVLRAALEERRRAKVPLDWAATQHRLGVALVPLGERRNAPTRLEEAVTTFRAALQERTRTEKPLDWALTQHRLGGALMRLGERESAGTARLEEAVAAFREALKERTEAKAPLEWAATMHDFALASMALGQRESETTARLEEAVAVFRTVLKERTRDTAPLEWAATLNSLALALMKLDERTNATALLGEAIAALRASLAERTRERVPLDWAATQSTLGIVLRTLGERDDTIWPLQEAARAFRAALEERTRDRVPFDWAATQSHLGSVLAALGEQETETAHLEEAAAAFRAALNEWTRAKAPAEWAATQNNLAAVLWVLGEREGNAMRLEEAVAACRAALEERRRSIVPLDWAMTQSTLGGALYAWGKKDMRMDRLIEAQQAVAKALKVFSNGAAPHHEKDALETMSKIQETVQALQRVAKAAATPVKNSTGEVLGGGGAGGAPTD